MRPKSFLDLFSISLYLKMSPFAGRSAVLACYSISFISILLLGCGKSPNAIASSKSKAFESAPAATKQAWQTAAAAARTNGYSAALIALSKIQADPTLTSEQGAAVRELSRSLSDSMYDAANKGDPAAKASLQELRKLQSR